MESKIVTDFGKSPMFFLYNIETEESRCVDNVGCDEDDHGKYSVECLSELGAETIIAVEVGCAAVNRLRGFQIDAYFANAETVGKNIDLFKNKSLRRMFSGECDGSCRT